MVCYIWTPMSWGLKGSSEQCFLCNLDGWSRDNGFSEILALGKVLHLPDCYKDILMLLPMMPKINVLHPNFVLMTHFLTKIVFCITKIENLWTGLERVQLNETELKACKIKLSHSVARVHYAFSDFDNIFTYHKMNHVGC